MFNLQKFFLILFFCVVPIIAMENDKVINQNKKSIFVPTTNTPQINADLLKILQNTKNNGIYCFHEQDWENIKKCLQNSADPNLKTNDYSETPLIYLAVQHDRKDLFEYLLQLGADINAHDTYDWTLLHEFISKFNSQTKLSIEYLLQNGANPNAKNFSKETPFFYALVYGHLNFIPSLIQYNANVNYINGGVTPLGQTIVNSYQASVANYYDINQNQENINNAQEPIINTIKILCKAGASAINVDDHGNTIFHRAVHRPEKIIKTFITHINCKNNNNNNLTDTIKTFLLVFHRFDNDPQSNIFNIPHILPEIQILILSKLLSVHAFHEGLWKKCKGEQLLRLKLVNEHVQCLKKILKIKNNYNRTALELVQKKFSCAEAEFLLDGSKLQNDLNIFNGVYPDITLISEDNLARQIFENHYS